MVRILLLLFCFTQLVSAQNLDSIVQRKIAATRASFISIPKEQFLVAIPYTANYVSVSGSQFYNNLTWQASKLTYKGKQYALKMLKYDCLNNQMVTVKYTLNGPEYLVLMPKLYPEVLLGDDHFVYHVASKDEASAGVGSGYYHKQIEGDLSLWVTYKKGIKEQSGVKKFFQKAEPYISADNKVIKVRRLPSIISVFPQFSENITAFAHDNKINALLPLTVDETAKIVTYLNTLIVQ